MAEPLKPVPNADPGFALQDDFLVKFQENVTRMTGEIQRSKALITEQEQRLRVTETGKKELEKAKAELEGKALLLSDELQRSKVLISEQEQKLRVSESGKKDAEKTKSELESKVLSLTSEQQRSKAYIAEQEQRLRTSESARKEAEMKLSALSDDQLRLKNSLNDLEVKTRLAEAAKKEIELRLEPALKSKAELEAKTSELQSWQDEAIERAQSMFKKHEELIKVLEETEAAEQQAKEQLLKLQERVANLERYESDLELLKKDNQKMQKTLATSEQAATQERNELQSEKQRLAATVAEKDKGLSETKSALEQTREAIARSQRMAEQAVQELEQKKQELEALQTQKLQQERTLQVMKNEQAVLHQTLSASNAAAQKEFEHEKSRLAQNLADKEKGLSQVKTDLDLMREAMARSQKMAEQAMSELNDSRSRTKLLTDELDRCKRMLEDEKVATQKRLESRQQEYLKLQAASTAIQIKLDEAHEKLAKSDRDQAASQRKIQQMEDSLAEVRDAIRVKELEVDAARRELVPLQELLAQTQVELNQTRTELASNNHELEFIFSRMGNLSDRINPGSGAALSAAVQNFKNMPLARSGQRTQAPETVVVPQTYNVPRQTAPVVSQVSFPSQGAGVFSMNGINLEQLALVDFPGDVPITISELLCACMDPNWREAWLAGQKPDVFRLIPREAPVAAGGHFYEVIEEFIDWLISDAALSQGAGEWGEQELWKALHDMFLEQRLNAFVAQGQFNETNFLSRRLRSFCQRISQLRQRTPGFRGWGHVFPPNLIDVPRAVFPMGDCRLVVTGTIYGTRTHPDFGLELVDYKVLPTAPEENHLLPLALNALILSALKPDISFGLGLESFSPEWEFVPVTHNSINALLRERVVPVFYEMVNRSLPADLKNPALEFIKTPHVTARLG